jgi:ferredoxin
MSGTALVVFDLEDLEVEVPLGASFIDVVEVSGADVTFGCKNGSCGTCKIRVVEGLGNLSEMNAEEADFLASIEAQPNQRLGCQCKIKGDVRISL